MIDSLSKKKCSSLAWGTGAVFGHACPTYEANELINILLDKGINLFDTGPSYSRGKSQRLLAKCLKSSSVKREDFLISTKVGSIPPKIPFGKTTKSYTKSSFEKLVTNSLNDFKTDYLDILFLHGLPIKEMDEEAYSYFNSLKKQGKVRFLGVSAHNKKEFEWVARNSKNIDVLMCHYNLLNYEEVEPYLLSFKKESITIIGSTPFAGGLLSKRKKFENLSTFKRDFFYLLKSYHPKQRRYNKKAKRILKEINNKINSKLFPLEFSLNAQCIDVTLFGSVSKKSILSSADLLEKLNL
tara:strand:- start:57 stop:947 length:891 start_codon:yes stop_codon:yes gene_type:complete